MRFNIIFLFNLSSCHIRQGFHEEHKVKKNTKRGEGASREHYSEVVIRSRTMFSSSGSFSKVLDVPLVRYPKKMR